MAGRDDAYVKALADERWGRWEHAIRQRDDKALGALQRLLAFMGDYDLLQRWEPSERECEVLQWAARGKKNSEIARELGISRETVKSHLKNVTRKLQANSVTHAVAIAWRRCLID